MKSPKPEALALADARRHWLRAQRLDAETPFGKGPKATQAAIEHLGYVQIDTINVIERCHHHILFSRIPAYKRADLRQAQTVQKSVFEYWTHALSYVPTRDLAYYLPAMRRTRLKPSPYLARVTPADMSKVLRRIRKEGALSIRDITDDVLVEKDHDWASRKPSKRALQLGFYSGRLVVSERIGMLKTYELAERHFGWERAPKPASPREVTHFRLERALRSQGVVSLDSICHLNAPAKLATRLLIDKQVREGRLVPIALKGFEKVPHWMLAADFEAGSPTAPAPTTHLLSPFDPLIIQRKRLSAFFGYDHIFEAYVPKEKRKLGYFALPALVGDRIVAAIDLKTDRAGKRLLMQKWTWMKKQRSPETKRCLEEALHRFEAFQLAAD